MKDDIWRQSLFSLGGVYMMMTYPLGNIKVDPEKKRRGTEGKNHPPVVTRSNLCVYPPRKSPELLLPNREFLPFLTPSTPDEVTSRLGGDFNAGIGIHTRARTHTQRENRNLVANKQLARIVGSALSVRTTCGVSLRSFFFLVFKRNKKALGSGDKVQNKKKDSRMLCNTQRWIGIVFPTKEEFCFLLWICWWIRPAAKRSRLSRHGEFHDLNVGRTPFFSFLSLGSIFCIIFPATGQQLRKNTRWTLLLLLLLYGSAYTLFRALFSVKCFVNFSTRNGPLFRLASCIWYGESTQTD